MRVNKRMDVDELIQILNNHNIIIYGTGYAAHNFFTALKLRRLEDRVTFFMKTNVSIGESTFCGKAVVSIDEIGVIDKDTLICVAVHEANLQEIEEIFLTREIKQYIWVHPYIFELALGKMVEKGVMVPVKKILYAQQKNNYLIAIRYLAVENFFSENDFGFAIYKKALEIQCEKETAKKRMASFKQLIKSWCEEGYKNEYPILIDEKLRLIDGTHRFSLSLYFKKKDIVCNILPASVNYKLVAKDTDNLPENLLQSSNFTNKEIELIKLKQKMIWRNMTDGHE